MAFSCVPFVRFSDSTILQWFYLLSLISGYGSQMLQSRMWNQVVSHGSTATTPEAGKEITNWLLILFYECI